MSALAKAAPAEDVPRDRAWFATRIAAAWRKSLAAVIETGRALIDAKAALEYGEFEAMCEKDLPFGPRAARYLMTVTKDERLQDRKHASVLPASWMTLHELTKLDDATFTQAVETGAIHRDMERKEAVALHTATRRVERLARAERIAATAPPPLASLAAKRRYAVLYADPPWRFETLSEAGKTKSAENHYPTMTDAEILALPMGELAGSTAALFLWATAPHLALAMRCIERWGFQYRSHLVWRKTNADGTLHRGTGFWFVNTHELLLLAARGSSSAGMPAPLMGTQAESVIDAPVGRHSEKPEIFRRIIETYFPGVARLELFRRGAAPDGWDAWGNEVPKRSGGGEGPP